MKKRTIIILLILISVFLTSGDTSPQDANDPIQRMYQLFLANSFNISIDNNKYSIATIPVYINNFSDYTLKDSTYQPNLTKYVNFPMRVKPKSSETGYIYYALFHNLMLKAPNDLFIKYNFSNSYRTPFVFHILAELPSFPKPPQSTHDGIKAAIDVASRLIGYIPGFGEFISILIDLFSFTIFKVIEYVDEEVPMTFYSLAYTYTNNKDIDVPQTIFYADSTGTPSTNACYMYHCSPTEPSDTGFVIENMALWPRKISDVKQGNFSYFNGAAFIVNIYNTWEYFKAKLKSNAEMIKKYKPEYVENPRLKKLVDDLDKKSMNEIAVLYSGNYNTIDAIETDKLLDDFFKGEISINSSAAEKKLKRAIEIHGLE